MDLRATIKFLKSEASDGPSVRLQPTVGVFVYGDKVYTVDNTIETILCLIVGKSSPHPLVFDVITPVRRVVLDGTDLDFTISGNQLSLTLPSLEQNADRTADMHMILPISGVDLRIEVPSPAQSAGKYNESDYPTRARRAATTLEFALFDAVIGLGLDQTIGQGPCGPIYVMGFDTNNPCGHTDWPPHVHMHMARPSFGAPIGHYYFDDHMLISHNVMYLRGSNVPSAQFEREENCVHLAPDGSVLFDLKITKDGGFLLEDGKGKTARIAALGQGFDAGALIEFGAENVEIYVEADSNVGEINVVRNGQLTRYIYDTDTGAYLSQTEEAASEHAIVGSI